MNKTVGRVIAIVVLLAIIISGLFIIKKLDEREKKENTQIITREKNNIFKEAKDYKDENFERYLEYKNSNDNIEIDSIIKMVNHDIDQVPDLVYNKILDELVDEKYFINSNAKRYIEYSKKTNLPNTEVILNVNSNIDYDFYTNTMPADLNKGNLVLVNKYYYLDAEYEPTDLVAMSYAYSKNGGYLRSEAYDAFKEMADEAYKEGIDLYSILSYRSYSTQESIYENFASVNGYEEADKKSVKPGYSEHQTGLAIDINSTDDSFAYSKEYEWLKKNCYKYGFILRYPNGKESITGFAFEPWHYRYVGKDVAKEINDLGITFDEYYAYYIK